MLPPRPDVRAELQADPIVGVLPSSALDALTAAAHVEHLRRATLLQASGEPLAWLRRVIAGHLEIIARHASGDEVSIGDIGPGGWATWAGALNVEPMPFELWAPVGTQLLALPARAFREACAAHPAIYPLIIGEMGQRLRQLMEWTGESVLLGPEQRMAKLIHMLARLHGLPAIDGTLVVTQARLARMARCSRQSANQLLGALEARGLIATDYGRFRIRDLAALKTFIESGRFET